MSTDTVADSLRAWRTERAVQGGGECMRSEGSATVELYKWKLLAATSVKITLA